jgi:hypothetical protein
VFQGGKFAAAKRAAELAGFVEKYARFEATAASGRIQFAGKGQTCSTDAKQQRLSDWAWLVQMEAQDDPLGKSIDARESASLYIAQQQAREFDTSRVVCYSCA